MAKVVKMGSALLKRLEPLLEGHVAAHFGEARAAPVRVLWPDATRPKQVARIRHHFTVKTGCGVLATGCASLARRGLSDVREAGAILMIESERGDSLLVEMEEGASAASPGPLRVSSGAITAIFERAVRSSRPAQNLSGSAANLNVLRVPAMHLSAVWSRNPELPKEERIVAYTENLGGLKIGRVYSARRAEAILRASATQMILRWYERQEDERAERRRAPASAIH